MAFDRPDITEYPIVHPIETENNENIIEITVTNNTLNEATVFLGFPAAAGGDTDCSLYSTGSWLDPPPENWHTIPAGASVDGIFIVAGNDYFNEGSEEGAVSLREVVTNGTELRDEKVFGIIDNDDWKARLVEVDSECQEMVTGYPLYETENLASFVVERYNEEDTTWPCNVQISRENVGDVLNPDYTIEYEYVEDQWQQVYWTGGPGKSFQVAIPAGETSVSMRVVPLDDQIVEPLENINLQITEVSYQSEYGPPIAYYTIGSPDTLSITIDDNDFGIKASPALAQEPKEVENWELDEQGREVEETEGAAEGAFEIYRLSGFNLARNIKIAYIPQGSGYATLDSDEDEVLEGDYELRWNDGLMEEESVIPFPAGESSHTVNVIPFYDLLGESAESVTIVLAAVIGETDTAAIFDYASGTVIIDASPLKPCTCLCSTISGGTAGAAGFGLNATTGNMGAGDSDNDVMHYSNFANDRQTILADSGLTVEANGYDLTCPFRESRPDECSDCR